MWWVLKRRAWSWTCCSTDRIESSSVPPETGGVSDVGSVATPRKRGWVMKTRRIPLTGRPVPTPLNLTRPGMPSVDSIHEAHRVITARGRRFRVIRTTEVDEYESTPAAISLRRVLARRVDRKSTRLNSSHITISYAVFCLKKKTQPIH